MHVGSLHHRGEKTQWCHHFTKADKTADSNVYNANICYATDKNRSWIKMKVKKLHDNTLWKPVSDIQNFVPFTKMYILLWKKVQLCSCNWHIEAKEASSWHNPARQRASSTGLSSLNLILNHTYVSKLKRYPSKKKKKISLGIFSGMTKTLASQSLSNSCS